MKRISATAILVLILCLAVHSQTTFIKTLSFPQNHDGYAVRPSFDGGYIIASKGPPALLIKTDAKGDTLWTRKLPMFLPYSENMLLQTPDSGIVICGGNGNMMVMKTGKNGDSLWSASFQEGTADAVEHTIDGGFILAGSRYYEVFLVKTGPAGKLQWSKTYFPLNVTNVRTTPASVKQTADSGFVVAGNRWDTTSVFLMKTNKNGDLAWSKGYRNTILLTCNSLCNAYGGGFILAGGAGPAFIRTAIAKTDPAGTVVWNKSYSRTFMGSYGLMSVSPVNGGGYIATGEMAPPGDNSQLSLVRINEAGDSLWTRVFPNGYQYMAIGYSARQTPDNGFIVSGNLIDIFSGTNQLYLVKTDAGGNVFPAGLDPAGTASTARFYPNPCHGTLTLEAGKERISRIEIFDMTGICVVTRDCHDYPEGNTVIVIPPGLKGLYMLRLTTGDSPRVSKISIY
ncbi:MAG: T9SS type A sorting domain-containing protein [Bacteroidota bacterium]